MGVFIELLLLKTGNKPSIYSQWPKYYQYSIWSKSWPYLVIVTPNTEDTADTTRSKLASIFIDKKDTLLAVVYMSAISTNYNNVVFIMHIKAAVVCISLISPVTVGYR